MKVINVPQNSEKWFGMRKARIGGSRVAKVRTTSLANKTDLVNTIYARTADDVDIDGLEAKEANDLLSKYKKDLAKKTYKELMGMLTRDEFTNFFHTGTKIEYFRVLAERMGYEDDPDEDPRDRGHRLEDEAAEAFEREMGIDTFKAGMCVHDEYEEIYVSPDRLIVEDSSIVDLDENGFINNVDDVTFVSALEIKNPGVVNHLVTIFTNQVPSEYWNQVLQYFVVTPIDHLYYVSHNPLVVDRPIVIIRIDREEVQAQVEESYEEQVKIVEQLKADEEALAF